jgi:hypothetical protein
MGGGGHAPLGRADRSRFLAALDVMVVAARREAAAGTIRAAGLGLS